MAAKLHNRERESRRYFLTREETMRGVLRADPSYRRDFFEHSVRVRARARRKLRADG